MDVERDGSLLSLQATLSGRPTEIPLEFPPSANLPDAEGTGLETGVIEVRVAEHANSCSAYVPEEYDGRRPYGLLVSLAPPGSEDPAKLLDPWKEVCARHDLILLAPQSQDAQRWMPLEVDFVRKTIDQIVGRYPIDQSRIAVHGREGGAAMAYLVSFTQRDAVRGVIAEDAPLPSGLRQPRNEPLQPLAILATVASQSRLASPHYRRSGSTARRQVSGDGDRTGTRASTADTRRTTADRPLDRVACRNLSGPAAGQGRAA